MPSLSAIAPTAPSITARRRFLRRQPCAGERDHDGVVGAEQEIDEEDLQEDEDPGGAVDHSREPPARSPGSDRRVERRARQCGRRRAARLKASGPPRPARCLGPGAGFQNRMKSASGLTTIVGAELASALR